VKAVNEAVMKAADTHRKGILDRTVDLMDRLVALG